VAPEPSAGRVAVRPFTAGDNAFLSGVACRLIPAQSASPRDPAELERFFANLAQGKLLSEPGSEAFVATLDGEPAGVVTVHPDSDYFTGHPRAYVDILVVASSAEGQGVGRALMARVEAWAREHGCREVVLDVFAGNEQAIIFYRRNGYQPDHIRMTKPLT
jgi:GNAT superfamily N-acetyltransferase